MEKRIPLLLNLSNRRIERQRRTGATLPDFAKYVSMRAHDLSRWERHEIDLPPERVTAIEEGLRRLEVSR
jgi:DNA-binding transcriptional regulator YiaG